MKVIFNGELREVNSTRLGDIIKELDGAYKAGCIIAITSEKKGGELMNEFAMQTTKGEARIIITGKKGAEALSLFHEMYKNIHNEQGKIGWLSEEITAIGPFGTELSVDKRERKYKKWDVFFGFGGFDPGLTYLMISKHEHEAAYGTGADAILGRITRGRKIIEALDESDRIESITPLVTQAERVGVVTTDLDTEIEKGQEISTYAKIQLSQDAPMSSEHFLSLIRNDVLRVDDAKHTYIASGTLKGLNLPLETIQYRSKYSVSVRNKGTDKGQVYVYKGSRLPHPSHSVFGEVIKGGDLIEYAKVGDSIYTVTEPRWMMVVGHTQKEAEAFFDHHDIEQVREGNQDDDAVVVDQVPALTMDIVNRGTVRTVGVGKQAVFEVVLFNEEAPQTVWYFKKVTGLITRPIGNLKVHFTLPGMLVLFQGNADEAGTLVPENLLTEGAKVGMLGVTNMSRPSRGMMGIRFEESKEYGPTGETFEGANLVLSFVSLTPEKLSYLNKLKEGDVIYVMEKQ